MDFKDFLDRLDEGLVTEQKEVFTKEQLDPVIIQKPPKGGKGGSPPPPKGGGQVDVEIHNVGEPEGQDGDQKGQQGQQQKGGEGGKSGEGQQGQQQKGGVKSKAGDSIEGEPGEREPGPDGKGPDIERVKAGKKQRKKKMKPGKQRTSFDSHEILEKSQAGEAKEMAEKIFEAAEERRRQAGQENQEGERGTETGSFLEKLKGIYKPRIDWAKELKKRINSFKSRSSSSIDRLKTKGARYQEGEGRVKSKSYLQWLKDPRSHSQPGKNQMIFKGPYVKAPIAEVILIIALDTSGSIGEDTISKVFSEMDKIARNFKSGVQSGSTKIEGKVYFMTWDTQVKQVEPYEVGGWKQYVSGKKKVAGQGGTSVDAVYRYINSHLKYDEEKTKKAAIFNLVEEPTQTGISQHDIIIPMKNGKPQITPFLVIATDGYFGQVNDQDLGMMYQDNHDSITYLIIDGTSQYCYPKDKKNIIEYASYRI